MYEGIISALMRASERLMPLLQDGGGPSSYWSIEGMQGYRFSVGIFVFMMAGVLVFGVIVYHFFMHAGPRSSIKRGEKILFIWIVIGMFVAVTIGAVQLLYGRLF
ncbi:MAG: hypothetical protein RBT81_01100 [Gammaproteobacteria bacterium]|nr:hypothetical protein [Gammaproteobacteria bacterium]